MGGKNLRNSSPPGAWQGFRQAVVRAWQGFWQAVAADGQPARPPTARRSGDARQSSARVTVPDVADRRSQPLSVAPWANERRLPQATPRTFPADTVPGPSGEATTVERRTATSTGAPVDTCNVGASRPSRADLARHTRRRREQRPAPISPRDDCPSGRGALRGAAGRIAPGRRPSPPPSPPGRRVPGPTSPPARPTVSTPLDLRRPRRPTR